jgi:hypothetical protein
MRNRRPSWLSNEIIALLGERKIYLHLTIDPDKMVSLEKKSPEERLNICRKYYLGGFLFLPLLWLINAIWFYKQAFHVEPFVQQAQIRTCN